MGEEHSLETPQASSELYLAFGDDLEGFELRPAFTGDVYEISAERSVALVQHPCAMRRGLELSPRLLVCDVRTNGNGVPPDWSTGNFKRMFLPGLADGSFVIEFEDMGVVDKDVLESARRLAILSTRGVNLLVQRWLFHNSRVVVPTITINAQTSGPFEEADLMQEACTDLVGKGKGLSEATQLVDGWLGERIADGLLTRRNALADPQQRSVVRATLRRQLKDWYA